jgi:hypothetical protein
VLSAGVEKDPPPADVTKTLALVTKIQRPRTLDSIPNRTVVFPQPDRASGPRNHMKINNFSTRYPSMSGVIFDPENCCVRRPQLQDFPVYQEGRSSVGPYHPQSFSVSIKCFRS